MMRRISVIFFTAVIITAANMSEPTFSQETTDIELKARTIVAKVDKIFNYPMGQMKGRLKHITPDGHAFTIRLTGKITKGDFLFTFSSKDRGNQLRVLYNKGGEYIWVYNILSLKLYNKLGIDKFDSVLSTNFSFVDLSNADFQSNYTATFEGKAIIKKYDAYRIKLRPIRKGGEYGYLTLYVTRDKYIPIRIDYHDRDNAIFKFLSVVKIKERKNKIIPLRYDMLDIRKGTVTILNFYDFDPTMKFNKEMFRSDKLGD